MTSKDILFITPPFTQLNTPYPASAFLKGFLKEHNYDVAQLDLGIETILTILNREGLEKLFSWVKSSNNKLSADAQRLLKRKDEYIACVDPVISFLQGKDNAMAQGISSGMLPEGPRFDNQMDMEWFFGTLGVTDKAKYLSTFFIEDLGDFITECVDPNFGFSRYAEHLCIQLPHFDSLRKKLDYISPITEVMLDILEQNIKKYQPKVIGFTIPFPGNLYAGLQAAKYIKKQYPNIPIIMGGGYVNTELREMNEPLLFDYIDYLTLDDGERPVKQLLDNLIRGDKLPLSRTFIRSEGMVKYINNTEISDYPHSEIGTPDMEGLPIDRYISVLEVANPMHRLWSDGRWNKLMVAHGCYWHKCSFCDVNLDYIKRYSKASASQLCDRIESLIQQTGQRGFHFVDEAAPPQVLREMAQEILRRNIRISWWTNVRFEKSYSKDLCLLLKKSGCIAVSGGLEVASDRLLKLMNKGVSIEQVARVTQNFQHAGVMVHAYLMYGFPTQTTQETIDSLEVVRQLFSHGLIQSAFWHRFTMTVHSPVGKNPEDFKVIPGNLPPCTFAKNGWPHEDPTGTDHEKFGFGLRKSLYNYMHDMCFELPLQEWFDFKIPHTTIPRKLIKNALKIRKVKKS